MELGASNRSLPADRQPSPEDATQSTDSSAKRDSEATRKNAELMDASCYDFDRLERVVAQLVEQQADLKRENAALRAGVEERDAQIRRLEGDLARSEERRGMALQRLDGLIAELDRLDEAMEAGAATAAGGDPGVTSTD